MRSTRGWLALIFLVTFPVALLLMVGGAGWLAYLALSSSHAVTTTTVALFVILPVALALGYGVFTVLRAKPKPVEGYEITVEAHPMLWAQINESARAARTARAERAVVITDVNAAVTQAAGHRELVIGLPLLGTLSVLELSAVLAHEFGHFGQGHTRFAALTWRANSMLRQVSARSGGLGGLVLRAYSRLYALAAAASSRDQEWRADEYAARLAGPDAAASALHKVVATQVAWGWLLDRFVPVAEPAGRRPPLVEGLRGLMAANARLLDHTVAETLNSGSKGVWSASHPPMKDRIARFESQARAMDLVDDRTAPTHAPDDSPASSLLAGGADAFDAIEQALSGDPNPRASWDEVIGLGAAAIVMHEADALMRSAKQIGELRTGSLDGLLDSIARGRGPALASPLVDPAVPPELRAQAESQVLVSALTSAVTAELVETGRARHALDWTVVWRFVDRSGAPITLQDDVAAVVEDPSRMPVLREHLSQLGVPVPLSIVMMEPTPSPDRKDPPPAPPHKPAPAFHEPASAPSPVSPEPLPLPPPPVSHELATLPSVPEEPATPPSVPEEPATPPSVPEEPVPAPPVSHEPASPSPPVAQEPPAPPSVPEAPLPSLLISLEPPPPPDVPDPVPVRPRPVVAKPDPVPQGVLTRMSAPQTSEEIDVVVCDSGLLLVPVENPGLTSMHTRKKGALMEAENARIDATYPGGFREWRAMPGAAWLDTTDIVGASVNQRPVHTLTFDLIDGSPLVLSSTKGTIARGPAHQAIADLLGTRLRA